VRQDAILFVLETRALAGLPQILDKSDFFELLENFALIRFDFGQKAPGAANGNFKPA